MENVNDSYFDGHYREIWRALIPSILTSREVEFIISHFNLGPQTEVLDIMCGYGRHCLALGRRGIPVTAVDNLKYYTDEISMTAKAENLPIKIVNDGILHFKPKVKFQFAMCMGNSLNFFNEADTLTILNNISSCMQEDGSLLINSWSFAEIALPQFAEKSEAKVGNLTIKSSSKLLENPTRIESETRIEDDNGLTETKFAVDYIFSIPQFEELLHKSEFYIDEIYSIPGKKKFTDGEPRAYLIAKKGNPNSRASSNNCDG